MIKAGDHVILKFEPRTREIKRYEGKIYGYESMENAKKYLRPGEKDALLMEYAPVARWIPVEERLPEHNKSVLVYCENTTIQGGNTVHIGSCDTACGAWFLRTQPGVSSFPNREWRVTHWMPLPEPPEA